MKIYLNIEKIIFKVVQMKFLAMHIANQKFSFDIFTVRNLQNIFMEHDLNILMKIWKYEKTMQKSWADVAEDETWNTL